MSVRSGATPGPGRITVLDSDQILDVSSLGPLESISRVKFRAVTEAFSKPGLLGRRRSYLGFADVQLGPIKARSVRRSIVPVRSPEIDFPGR